MAKIKIIKDTIYYGVVPRLTMLVSIVTLPLVTPFLTTYDYGIYGVVNSYSGFLLSLVPLGMHVHLTNSFFELPTKYHLVWGRVLFFVLLSSFFFGLINFSLLMITLPSELGWKKLLMSLIGTLPLLLHSNELLAKHLFPLVQRPRSLVFTNLAGSLIGMLFYFVFIYFFDLGYWGLIISGAVSAIVIFVLFIKQIWVDYNIWPIVDKNIKRIKEMYKVALPLVPHTLGFALLASSARIIMSWANVPYDDIGLYSHGCSMGNYAIVITTALVTAITPQIQKAYRTSDFSRYRKLYYLCQSVSLLSSFLICVWIPEIYHLLIKNAQLAQSSEVASLYCFANVVLPFYTFASIPVFINRNTTQLLWLVFVPGILNVILCVVGIPLLGFRAAIYSIIIAYWSQLAIPFFVSYYKQNVKLWLGSLKTIILLLFVLSGTVIVAQNCAVVNIYMKLMTTIFLVIFFSYFYKKMNFNSFV